MVAQLQHGQCSDTSRWRRRCSDQFRLSFHPALRLRNLCMTPLPSGRHSSSAQCQCRVDTSFLSTFQPVNEDGEDNVMGAEIS